MAYPHHDAAHDYQRRSRETKLLGAKQCSDDNVATRFQLPIGLHDDTVAQPVCHQNLLRFGNAQLPG